MFTFSFPHRISMGHRLCGEASPKCQTPHGHNEIITLEIRLGADPIDGKANMAAEFGILKGAWKRWLDATLDHAFQIADHDPLLPEFQRMGFKLVVCPGDPTTELLAALLLNKAYVIMHAIPSLRQAGFHAYKVTVEETPSNIVGCIAVPVVVASQAGWWSAPESV